MSAKRLSSDDRENIYTHLAAHAFGDRRKEVEAAKRAVSDAVYNDLYPAPVLRKMKALPKGWLPEDSDVQVKIAGNFMRLHFMNEKGDFVKRLMQDSHTSGAAAIYVGGHPVTEAYEHNLKLRKQLEEDERRARGEAMATLNRAANAKQLVEMWPEVKPFVEKVFGNSGAPLPVVALDKLNDRFKLPAEKKADAKGKKA